MENKWKQMLSVMNIIKSTLCSHNPEIGIEFCRDRNLSGTVSSHHVTVEHSTLHN